MPINAITTDGETAKLILKVENGTTKSGGTNYSNRTISGLNPDLSIGDTYSIGSALAGLQTHTLEGIYRSTTAQLVSE